MRDPLALRVIETSSMAMMPSTYSSFVRFMSRCMLSMYAKNGAMCFLTAIVFTGFLRDEFPDAGQRSERLFASLYFQSCCMASQTNYIMPLLQLSNFHLQFFNPFLFTIISFVHAQRVFAESIVALGYVPLFLREAALLVILIRAFVPFLAWLLAMPKPFFFTLFREAIDLIPESVRIEKEKLFLFS